MQNSDLINLSRDTAEKIIEDTIRLLNKSLDILEYEPDNKSARFNIQYGFIKDIDDCRTLLSKNMNIPKNSQQILNDALVTLNSRRLTKIKELGLK